VLTKRSFDNAGFAMTPGEVMAFFAERPRYATVITLRRDGAPIGDGVSVEWDGDALYFSVRSHRPIVRRLARDARTCVHVMNAEYPVRWVRMEGSAESVEDPGYERSLRMMRRYMAPESPLQTLPGFDLAAFEADYTAAAHRGLRGRLHGGRPHRVPHAAAHSAEQRHAKAVRRDQMTHRSEPVHAGV
jgi:hypothetical protein